MKTTAKISLTIVLQYFTRSQITVFDLLVWLSYLDSCLDIKRPAVHLSYALCSCFKAHNEFWEGHHVVIPRRATARKSKNFAFIPFTSLIQELFVKPVVVYFFFCFVFFCSNVWGDSQTSICITIEPGLLLKGDILVRNLRLLCWKSRPSAENFLRFISSNQILLVTLDNANVSWRCLLLYSVTAKACP